MLIGSVLLKEIISIAHLNLTTVVCRQKKWTGHPSSTSPLGDEDYTRHRYKKTENHCGANPLDDVKQQGGEDKGENGKESQNRGHDADIVMKDGKIPQCLVERVHHSHQKDGEHGCSPAPSQNREGEAERRIDRTAKLTKLAQATVSPIFGITAKPFLRMKTLILMERALANHRARLRCRRPESPGTRNPRRQGPLHRSFECNGAAVLRGQVDHRVVPFLGNRQILETGDACDRREVDGVLPVGEVGDGVVSVTGGDTIEVSGSRIRLHGIDAPESTQTCLAGGKRWQCGRHATRVRRPVACEKKDRDCYGRIVAVCRLGDRDPPGCAGVLIAPLSF